jgi:hypothetical protein
MEREDHDDLVIAQPDRDESFFPLSVRMWKLPGGSPSPPMSMPASTSHDPVRWRATSTLVMAELRKMNSFPASRIEAEGLMGMSGS